MIYIVLFLAIFVSVLFIMGVLVYYTNSNETLSAERLLALLIVVSGLWTWFYYLSH